MLQNKYLVLSAIRVLPRIRWGMCVSGAAFYSRRNALRTAGLRLDGSALFRVFGRSRLFNVSVTYWKLDYFR